MMLYKNMKAVIRSPDSDTDFDVIVAGALQNDIFSSYLLIICLHHKQ